MNGTHNFLLKYIYFFSNISRSFRIGLWKLNTSTDEPDLKWRYGMTFHLSAYIVYVPVSHQSRFKIEEEKCKRKRPFRLIQLNSTHPNNSLAEFSFHFSLFPAESCVFAEHFLFSRFVCRTRARKLIIYAAAPKVRQLRFHRTTDTGQCVHTPTHLASPSLLHRPLCC